MNITAVKINDLSKHNLTFFVAQVCEWSLESMEAFVSESIGLM